MAKAKKNHFSTLFCAGLVAGASPCVCAEEWVIEPAINLQTTYNDNIRLYSENVEKQSTTSYSLEPKIKFKATELMRWETGLDVMARMTRYQDVDDVDSNNVFLNFNSGWFTERSKWRLNASFKRNTNFDTDYDTQSTNSSLLLDDHTEEETITLKPSVEYQMTESSVIGLVLSSADIEYDEVRTSNLRDYTYDSARSYLYTRVSESQQIGVTAEYAEFDRKDDSFAYDKTSFNLDYTYYINESSQAEISIGDRTVESESTVLICNASGTEFSVSTNECPPTVTIGFFTVPVTSFRYETTTQTEDGTDISFTYRYATENTSHNLTAAQSVSPSSVGTAQETRNIRYQLSYRDTERLSYSLNLSGSKYETFAGGDITSDRETYRFEPGVNYKLDKYWALNFRYSYMQRTLASSNLESESNALYLSLYLNWPKLASTY